MENKKATSLFLICFTLAVLLSSNLVLAEDCSLSLALVNQDPVVANPGDYVKVVLQLAGVENKGCKGAILSLDSSYPFSLENDNSQRVLSGNTYSSSEYSDVWNIPYTLRVDKGALDGESELIVNYRAGSWDSSSYITKRFNISVENSQTSFDAVIQEVSGSDVSIAIANIGKYTANSVVVRIPEQDSFTATSTNGQMVGNLESGDYTIVSFSLSSKSMLPTSQPSRDSKNASSSSQPSLISQSGNLTFDIYYTDNIGERRTITLDLPLSLSSSTSANSTIGSGNFPGNRKSSWSVWYTMGIIAGVLIIVFLILIKKFPKQTKDFFDKMKNKRNKKKNNSANQIPDWIKSNKEKERK